MTLASWPPQIIGLILIMLFFAITFLQSAVDKIMDWKGNLEFLTGHFKNSPLGSMVPLLLGTLTIAEAVSGLVCLYAIMGLIQSDKEATVCALTLSGVSLLMLLVGQRLAKDYAGAATIATYFVLLMLGFNLL